MSNDAPANNAPLPPPVDPQWNAYLLGQSGKDENEMSDDTPSMPPLDDKMEEIDVEDADLETMSDEKNDDVSVVLTAFTTRTLTTQKPPPAPTSPASPSNVTVDGSHHRAEASPAAATVPVPPPTVAAMPAAAAATIGPSGTAMAVTPSRAPTTNRSAAAAATTETPANTVATATDISPAEMKTIIEKLIKDAEEIDESDRKKLGEGAIKWGGTENQAVLEDKGGQIWIAFCRNISGRTNNVQESRVNEYLQLHALSYKLSKYGGKGNSGFGEGSYWVSLYRLRKELSHRATNNRKSWTWVSETATTTDIRWWEGVPYLEGNYKSVAYEVEHGTPQRTKCLHCNQQIEPLQDYLYGETKKRKGGRGSKNGNKKQHTANPQSSANSTAERTYVTTTPEATNTPACVVAKDCRPAVPSTVVAKIALPRYAVDALGNTRESIETLRSKASNEFSDWVDATDDNDRYAKSHKFNRYLRHIDQLPTFESPRDPEDIDHLQHTVHRENLIHTVVHMRNKLIGFCRGKEDPPRKQDPPPPPSDQGGHDGGGGGGGSYDPGGDARGRGWGRGRGGPRGRAQQIGGAPNGSTVHVAMEMSQADPSQSCAPAHNGRCRNVEQPNLSGVDGTATAMEQSNLCGDVDGMALPRAVNLGGPASEATKVADCACLPVDKTCESPEIRGPGQKGGDVGEGDQGGDSAGVLAVGMARETMTNSQSQSDVSAPDAISRKSAEMGDSCVGLEGESIGGDEFSVSSSLTPDSGVHSVSAPMASGGNQHRNPGSNSVDHQGRTESCTCNIKDFDLTANIGSSPRAMDVVLGHASVARSHYGNQEFYRILHSFSQDFSKTNTNMEKRKVIGKAMARMEKEHIRIVGKWGISYYQATAKKVWKEVMLCLQGGKPFTSCLALQEDPLAGLSLMAEEMVEVDDHQGLSLPGQRRGSILGSQIPAHGVMLGLSHYDVKTTQGLTEATVTEEVGRWNFILSLMRKHGSQTDAAMKMNPKDKDFLDQVFNHSKKKYTYFYVPLERTVTKSNWKEKRFRLAKDPETMQRLKSEIDSKWFLMLDQAFPCESKKDDQQGPKTSPVAPSPVPEGGKKKSASGSVSIVQKAGKCHSKRGLEGLDTTKRMDSLKTDMVPGHAHVSPGQDEHSQVSSGRAAQKKSTFDPTKDIGLVSWQTAIKVSYEQHEAALVSELHRSASEGQAAPRQYTRHTAGVSSSMHDAARLMQWDRVKLICQENPLAASYVGKGGYTALHHVCSRRCPHPEVFEAVIQACPDAFLIEETTKGWTPLHLACRFKCKNEAVQKLLTLHPNKGKHTVSKPDHQRRTPLYYAVRYDAPAGVVPQLLEADPSVVLADDQNLQSPLALVWDDFAGRLEGKRALDPFIGEQSSETTPKEKRENLQRTSFLYRNWTQANLFLKAAFGFPLNEGDVMSDTAERRWRILHATAAVKCHPSLFQMACALHPEQARELDENDLYQQEDANQASGSGRQTALHLAAASNATGPAGKAIITELLRLYPEAACMPDEIDGSYPLHRIAENKHKQHWTFDGVNPLYMMHPAAAHQTDQNGKLPLHRAATAIAHEQGDTEEAELATRSVICNLLQVHPEGAAVRDNDGCFPLHLIAKHGGDWTEEVQAVHEGHDRAVSVRAGRHCHNSLPIHLAAGNENASKAFIEKLVELNPRGVSQEDGQGKLPLHLACELGKKWEEEGVEAIHNAFPQAVSARERNDRQWMALHMAAASKVPCAELIQKLVQLHPEACQVQDSTGRLPFHLACESNKKWEEGLSALFEGNPRAIATMDNQGRLPLHIVADHHARERLDLTNMGMVDEETNELDVLFNLVRSDPTTIRETG